MAGQLKLNDKKRRSFYIQRLQIPVASDNAFGFIPLNKKGMDAVRDIFSFDYMGAWEFENGSIPYALTFIEEQAVNGNIVADRHRDVFYLAPTQYVEGVKALIEQLIENETDAGLEEYCGLSKALENRGSEKQLTIGWLEIDNGFIFTIDQVMFEKIKRLFGIA